MPVDGWIALAVATLSVVVMARGWADPPLALGGSVGVLLLLEILTAERALAGFANPAVATVALLLVLAGRIERSPWLPWLTRTLMGRRPGRRALLRSSVAVAGLSAFIANTPVVAVLIPAARDWAERHDESVSKVLMGISFAAILGGACTLVGTSTNLVVHGMLLDAGQPGLGMFELAKAAGPLALAGIAYMVLMGWRLIPQRHDLLERVQEDPREYVTRLRVELDSVLVGRRVSALRRLKNVYLAGLERDGLLQSPVTPDTSIQAGDALIFVGLVRDITELLAIPGVQAGASDEGAEGLARDLSHLVEAVVSPSSPVVGRNIRDASFRGRYDAVVLGVYRHGERIERKIGDIVLRPGDTLLLRTGEDFLSRWGASRDFYLVSSAGAAPADIRFGDWVEPGTLLAVVAVAALGVLPLLEAAVAGVVALLVARRLEPRDLWHSLDWPTLVTIAAAIGLGHAIVDSGAASAFIHFLTGVVGTVQPIWVVLGIFTATSLLTEGITNVAAAALMFPVATAAAQETGLPLHALAVAIALGASAAFLTPVGYQTNTMVAGAAGYTFGDFVRVGLPLKLLYIVGGSVAIPLLWGLG